MDIEVVKSPKRSQEYQKIVAHHLLHLSDDRKVLCKREQPDIDQAIVFLSLRVKDANEGYWKKVLRVMSVLKGPINNIITLEADYINTLTWYINVELAVKADI